MQHRRDENKHGHNWGTSSFKNPGQCLLQANGATLKQVEKFKYLGVAFTSDRREDEELDTRVGKASAVMRVLLRSVVMKRELSKKAKLSIFKTVFVPILTHGHESWVITCRSSCFSQWRCGNKQQNTHKRKIIGTDSFLSPQIIQLIGCAVEAVNQKRNTPFWITTNQKSAITSSRVRNEVFTKNRRIFHCLTRCVALRFKNLLTSSRYFSELKDLSLDGLTT